MNVILLVQQLWSVVVPHKCWSVPDNMYFISAQKASDQAHTHWHLGDLNDISWKQISS